MHNECDVVCSIILGDFNCSLNSMFSHLFTQLTSFSWSDNIFVLLTLTV